MANKRAKQERSAAKDIRQGVTEQRPVSSNKKKKKTYRLVGDFGIEGERFFFRDYSFGKYSSLKQAEDALASHEKKKYTSNLRIEEI